MKLQPSKGPGVFEGVDMDGTLVADAFASKFARQLRCFSITLGLLLTQTKTGNK